MANSQPKSPPKSPEDAMDTNDASQRPMDPPPVWGGILVGGHSRRMGAPKQNLSLGGQTFAERIAAALVPHSAGFALLGDGDVAPALAEVHRVRDAEEAAGPLAALLGAFAWRADVAWLVAACDLPLISTEAVAWLLDQRREGTVAILPRLAADHVEPLFALYEPAARPLLLALAEKGAGSLQPLAQAPGVATPSPPERIQESWRNVNTFDELRELR